MFKTSCPLEVNAKACGPSGKSVNTPSFEIKEFITFFMKFESSDFGFNTVGALR